MFQKSMPVKRRKKQNTCTVAEKKPSAEKNLPQPGNLKRKKKTVEPPWIPPWKGASFAPEPIALAQPSYYEQDYSGWDADDYLNQYIDDDILQLIVEKSNQTYFYKTNKLLRLSLKELKIWLGISFVMSALQYPQMRMYWDKKFRLPLIADSMRRDRYFLIRSSIKVVFDNEVPNEMRRDDRLWKVRPVLDKILAGCMRQPRNQEICVDEMMIPFSGKCDMKQYMPDKPNPVGLKVFVLANPNGVVCDFTVYQGKNTFKEETSKGFGLSASSVLHLTHSLVPGHIIYHDRWFTSVKLADELDKRGFRCSGTLMNNRIPQNNDLPHDKTFKKGERGSTCVSVRDDGLMAITKWLDNKPVAMLSTHESTNPMTVVKRWSKVDKKFISVTQPKVIQSYNKNMGGVDLANRMISYCPSKTRTNKWTLRCIMHFFDLGVSNAWLQMRDVKQKMNVKAKDIPQLRTFKIEYGRRLIEANDLTVEISEEDNEDEEEEEQTVERGGSGDGRMVGLPSAERRKQGAMHLPDVTTGVQKRCRGSKCIKKTSVFCTRCKVYLCLMGNRNCFKKFHS